MYFRDNNGKIILEGYNNQNMPTTYFSNNMKTGMIVVGVLLSLALLVFIIMKIRTSSYNRRVPYFLQ